jgi:hypothetical protein
MFRKLFYIYLLCPFFALSQIGPRTWQDHHSINSCNSVAKLKSKIYASNGVGVVYFDEAEIAPVTLTKINGLSDVGVSLLRTNTYNNKLMVIYANCNIDVIDEKGNLRNYPDIKLKSVTGKKIINEVTFHKNLAYLACGFGIVVFDMDRFEIRETYIIGPNGTFLDVLQVALDDSLVFAATEKGLFQGNYITKQLVNFKNWRQDTVVLPGGPYIGVIHGDGRTLCCYSRNQANFEIGKDILYEKTGNTWKKYEAFSNTELTCYQLGPVNGESFGLRDMTGFQVRKISDGALQNYTNSFNGELDYGTMRDAMFWKDHTGNMAYWIADARFGLYWTYSYYPYYPQIRIFTNGMNKPLSAVIDIHQGTVAVAPSHPDNTGTSSYFREGVNLLQKGQWSYIANPRDNTGDYWQDITHAFIDRKDPTRLWAGSWSYGLLEYKNNKLVKEWTPENTPTMPLAADNNPHVIGLTMDTEGNLWFANSETKNYLSVIRAKTRQYQSFEFDAPRFVRKVHIDKTGTFWILNEREGGITIFKNNNFKQPVLNSTFKRINNEVGGGGLQSMSVYSIAEDHDGKIWVGTAAGISVFYNPSQVWGTSNFDAQPIKIVQDGNVELLLSNEVVTAIVVDGANNKWVGTASGGFYCFSPDGLRELEHFTRENSPLYSNNIIDLNYDELTGDIYVATDIGLQSYRSITIKGEETYETAFAYPNPVKPNYGGTVLIRGLMDNSIVKITDVSGNMVWETKSTGGQVEWPVSTLGGSRVTSGVYLVYASTTDGTAKMVTKVMVIN